MTNAVIFHVALESWICIFNMIILLLSGKRIYRKASIMKYMWNAIILCNVLLVSDSLSYVFEGDNTPVGVVILPISVFVEFLMQVLILWYTIDITYRLLPDGGEKRMKDGIFRICTVLLALELLARMIAPFFKYYYYFDYENNYIRGTFNRYAFLLPLIALLLICAKVIISRKKFIRSIWRTYIAIFGVLLADMIWEVLAKGISLINITLTVCILLLFGEQWAVSVEIELGKQMEEMNSCLKKQEEKQQDETIAK